MTKVSRWFPYRNARNNAELRLFCFPHAGGGASSYHGWKAHLPVSIELCAVQPPGREGRFREPLCRTMDSLLDQLQSEIVPLLDLPAAFFGYSVGAVVAFALALRLKEQAKAAPVHLCVAACPSPRLNVERALRSSMSDSEFESRVLELNEYAPELIEHRELLELMIPVMRADMQIVESLRLGCQLLLSCPIYAVAGDADPRILRAHLEHWGTLTTGPFESRVFPGGHFFIRNNLAEAIASIITQLSIARAPPFTARAK